MSAKSPCTAPTAWFDCACSKGTSSALCIFTCEGFVSHFWIGLVRSFPPPCCIRFSQRINVSRYGIGGNSHLGSATSPLFQLRPYSPTQVLRIDHTMSKGAPGTPATGPHQDCYGPPIPEPHPLVKTKNTRPMILAEYLFGAILAYGGRLPRLDL